MGLFDIFKSKDTKSKPNVTIIKKEIQEELHLELEEGVIYDLLGGEVLDTENKENVEKFKHNIKELIKQTKEKGKVDKFKLIRDDDFFPYDGEWKVASKDTSLEKNMLGISSAIKESVALEKNGININHNGINIPVSPEKLMEAYKTVPMYLGSVLLPVHFRGTKHFTINTPLEVTGNYNSVSANRNFTVIDDMDNFLSSGYGYSIAYRDAYIDVTHKPLKLTDNAAILIRNDKYEELIKDDKLKEELKGKKVIRYVGEEYLAIDMVLTSMGVLPSQVGFQYAEYDSELKGIIETSLKEVASENGLKYNMSHAGGVKTPNIPGGEKGHFSNYYDDKNYDSKYAINEFSIFLQSKFPNYAELIEHTDLTNKEASSKLVEQIGTDNLLKAIDEYNDIATMRLDESLNEYKKDRETITDDIDNRFKDTLRFISSYYDNGLDKYLTVEEEVRFEMMVLAFLQSNDVKSQVLASQDLENVFNYINKKSMEDTLEMTNEVKNALHF